MNEKVHWTVLKAPGQLAGGFNSILPYPGASF